MKVLVFQHVPFEGLGLLEPLLLERQAEVEWCRWYQGCAAPELSGIDLLVVLGGPMGVNDQAECPWLVEEIDCVRRAQAQSIPTLGICLGAQIMAFAAGARVYLGPNKEVGWWPIRGLASKGHEKSGVSGGPIQFPEELLCFHWHGETFDLPEGAVLLASSEGCRQQAFQLGNCAIGLQCHLEMTPQTVVALIEHCPGDLSPGCYVQTQAQMLAVGEAVYASNRQFLNVILDYLLTH